MLCFSVILAISSEYTPKVNKKCVSNKPPWWSTQISKAVRDKQHLFSQYKYTRSVADYASYAIKRNQVKSMISSAKARHDKILIQKPISCLYLRKDPRLKLKTIDQ